MQNSDIDEMLSDIEGLGFNLNRFLENNPNLWFSSNNTNDFKLKKIKRKISSNKKLAFK